MSKKYDFTEHPKHYNGHKVKAKVSEDAEKQVVIYETIDLINSAMKRLEGTMSADELYNFGNAIKYMDRIGGGKPDGDKTVREKIYEDIEKIRVYLKFTEDLMKENGLTLEKLNEGKKK